MADTTAYNVCRYKVDSVPLYQTLVKRNALNSENVFTWRTCYNIYLWVKYIGPIIGFVLFYVIMGYALGKAWGIALPFLAPLFSFVVLLILFASFGGGAVLLFGLFGLYKTWAKSKDDYFQKHQMNFIGKYQSYSVQRGPFRMGSRNMTGKNTPWVLYVKYLDENGTEKIAQSYLDNTLIFKQMTPGDEILLCRIKGHFRKTLDVALTQNFYCTQKSK